MIYSPFEKKMLGILLLKWNTKSVIRLIVQSEKSVGLYNSVLWLWMSSYLFIQLHILKWIAIRLLPGVHYLSLKNGKKKKKRTELRKFWYGWIGIWNLAISILFDQNYKLGRWNYPPQHTIEFTSDPQWPGDGSIIWNFDITKPQDSSFCFLCNSRRRKPLEKDNYKGAELESQPNTDPPQFFPKTSKKKQRQLPNWYS